MKRGRLWIVGIIVLIAVAGGGWSVLHGPGDTQAATKPAPPPPVPVTVASTKVKDVPVFPGWARRRPGLQHGPDPSPG